MHHKNNENTKTIKTSHAAAVVPISKVLFCGDRLYKSSAVARLAEVYLHIKWHFDPCSRLATIDMGEKLVGAVPFFWESWVPSNTKSPGTRPTFIPSGILVHPAIWPQRTWAENWGLCPFRGRGSGSPSDTMSPRYITCLSLYQVIS